MRNFLQSMFGKFYPDSDNKKADFGLSTIGRSMVIGVIAILFVAWFMHQKDGFLPVLGLSLIIALAAVMAGGFLGFLFGIPKSQQRTDSKGEDFQNNTNLEQISDWLTKIIVGVSLIELAKIEKRLIALTKELADGFKDYMTIDFAQTYAGSILAFYAVCGFLFMYIWCMLYYLPLLNNKLAQKIKEVESNSELQIIRKKIDDFYKQRGRILNLESAEQLRGVIEMAKPEPVKWLDDCQKDRWGRLSERDGYKLEAQFNPNTADTGESYLVTLRVIYTNQQQIPPPPRVMVQNIYFFLHDSYYPECIKSEQFINGVAEIQIASYEAFTVGAFLPGPNLKLELDLNLCQDTPEEYKYTEPLVTIDDLKARRDELKKS